MASACFFIHILSLKGDAHVFKHLNDKLELFSKISEHHLMEDKELCDNTGENSKVTVYLPIKRETNPKTTIWSTGFKFRKDLWVQKITSRAFTALFSLLHRSGESTPAISLFFAPLFVIEPDMSQVFITINTIVTIILITLLVISILVWFSFSLARFLRRNLRHQRVTLVRLSHHYKGTSVTPDHILEDILTLNLQIHTSRSKRSKHSALFGKILWQEGQFDQWVRQLISYYFCLFS